MCISQYLSLTTEADIKCNIQFFLLRHRKNIYEDKIQAGIIRCPERVHANQPAGPRPENPWLCWRIQAIGRQFFILITIETLTLSLFRLCQALCWIHYVTRWELGLKNLSQVRYGMVPYTIPYIYWCRWPKNRPWFMCDPKRKIFRHVIAVRRQFHHTRVPSFEEHRRRR